MPQLPSLGSLTRAPWAHPARGSRPALAGVFKSVWAAARGAAAGFLVAVLRPVASGRLQSASFPSSEGTRVKSHPARGQRGRGPGESQASGGLALGFLPGPATPGGHRGSLEPLPCLCGLVCTLRGGSQAAAAAGARRKAGHRAGRTLRAPPPGGLRAGQGTCATPPGRPSGRAEPSRADCPGAAGPIGPPRPPSAPPPCPGRSKQETRKI